jgi:hypothetical protein
MLGVEDQKVQFVVLDIWITFPSTEMMGMEVEVVEAMEMEIHSPLVDPLVMKNHSERMTYSSTFLSFYSFILFEK